MSGQDLSSNLEFYELVARVHETFVEFEMMVQENVLEGIKNLAKFCLCGFYNGFKGSIIYCITFNLLKTAFKRRY